MNGIFFHAAVDKQLHTKAKRLAKKQDMTLSQLIRKAVREYVEKESKK